MASQGSRGNQLAKKGKSGALPLVQELNEAASLFAMITEVP